MQTIPGRAAALAAFALLTTISPVPAAAETPALIWRDVKAIGIQCVIQSDTRGHDAQFGAALCERVRRLAAQSAPAPVKIVPIGDPALLAADTVTLLVHGTIQSDNGGKLLAFSVRPFRASSEQTSLLYGAAPRAVRLTPAAAIDPALQAALGDILPWQKRPDGPRLIQ